MERNSEEDQHLLMQPSPEDRQTKTHISGFEISSDERSVQRFSTLRSLGGNVNKCYLLAISIPVFIILILVSINSGKLFHGDLPSLNLRTDSLMNRMRESELRALSLLKRQRMEFLRLWNLTLRDSVVTTDSFQTNFNVSANSSKTSNESEAHSVSAEDLRSELIKQIKMNEDIQSTLLASHLSGKENELFDSNVFDSDIFGSDKINRCSKLQPPATNRKMEWEPDPNKFLFAICNSGQMSNHMICLEKHMFFAALLGRSLIFPSPKVDYQYDRVLNISHVNTCFGKRVVVTFDEFEQMRKGRLRIDRFICYMSSCFLDEDHFKKLRGLGLTLPKLENAWQTDVDVNRRADEVRNKFSCGDDVLAVGDLFYARVEEEWLLQVGGPLVHTCKSVLQPHRLIYLTAQRFIQTFLGENFVALHFRRHGFLKFCNVKKESCFYPIPQAAECLARILEKSNAPVIYLSTDAAESETDLLQALMVVNGKTIPLVKRPAHTSVEKWDALLYRNHLGSDDQVDAMLDKTICAMSSVFIGASGSTFTEDIMRLRRAWGSVSVCDEYLCEGEKPNFIAEIG